VKVPDPWDWPSRLERQRRAIAQRQAEYERWLRRRRVLLVIGLMLAACLVGWAIGFAWVLLHH